MNLNKKSVRVSRIFIGSSSLIIAKLCLTIVAGFFSLSANAVSLVMPSTSSTGSYTITFSGSSYGYGRIVLDELVGSSYVNRMTVLMPTSSGTFNVTNKPVGTYTYRVTDCPAHTCSAPITKTITVTGTGSGSSSSAISVPPVGNTPLPAPSIVNQTTKVGSLTGSFKVDESGSANYTMPIAVPAGVAGVAPSVGIGYNSQGGFGLVGHGANISGLGAITRCRQTLLHDGVAKPITWGSEDRFCLNGQRLILVSGTYGAADSEYKTEIDNFSKIKAYGGTVGNPSYFEVKAKDGSTTTYGGTTDSKVNVASATLTWALSKFEDGVKNRIEYVYDGSLDNSHRIITIKYAYPTASSTVPAATVTFEYADRLDISSAYVGNGSISKNSKILKSVKSENGSTIFRKYNFYYNEISYSSVDQISRLTSAEECTSDLAASCFPKTKFEWGTKTIGFSASSVWLNNLPEASSFKGYRYLDFNGDGRQDIVWSQGSGTNRVIKYASIDKFSSSGLTGKLFSNGVGSLPFTVADNNKKAELILDAIDYNVDGKQDLVVCRPMDRLNGCTTRDVYLSVPTAYGTWALSHTPIALPFRDRAVKFGDINGDGVVDAFVLRYPNIVVYSLQKRAMSEIATNQYYQFNELATLPLTATPAVPPLVPNANSNDRPKERYFNFADASLGDFNADGKMDVVIPAKIIDPSIAPYATSPDENTQTSYAYVYINNGNSFIYSQGHSFDVARTAYVNQPDIFDTTNIQVVDFNGDGFSDVAARGIALWKYWKNDGTKLIAGGNISSNNSSQYVTDSVGFLDYNRDGNADFIWHDTQNKQLKLRKWLPATLTFETTDTVVASSKAASSNFSFADMNGDSFSDLLEQKVDSNGYVDIGIFYGNGSATTLDNIYTVTDGNNNKTQVNYGSLASAVNYTTLEGVNTQQVADSTYCANWTDVTPCLTPIVYALNSAAFYTAINQPFGTSNVDAISVAPVLEMAGSIYAVTKVFGSAPVAANPNNMSSISYHYHHARIQAGGRGYLGFEKLTTIDQQTGISTETTYHQDWPFTGSPKSTIVKTKEGKILSTANNTWISENNSTNSKVKRVFLDTTTEVSYALQGNGTLQGASLQTTTTDTDYDIYGNVTKITAVASGSANTSTKITTNTYYNTTEWEQRMGRLDTTTTSVQRNTDASPTVRTTKFIYHSENSRLPGMLEQEIIEPGTNQKVTIHKYDDVGNKISTEITANVQPGVSQKRITTIEYDPSKRFAETTKDSLGNTVSGVIRRHPIHGSPTEVRDTNGVITYIDYLEDGREQQRRDSVGAWAHTDRGLCSDGAISCPASARYWVRNLISGGGKTVEFSDVLGRVIRSGKVMFDGRESYVDTEYDNLGRVSRKSEPYFSGETIYWSVFEYDILGRVTKVTAPDGSISTNTYNGYKTTTTNTLQQSRTEERNSLGHLVKVTDNLSGTISYGYDALGNLTSVETVASGKTVKVQMCYDSLGRKIAMHDPDKGGFLGYADYPCATVYSYLNKTAPEKLSGWWFYQYNDFGELIEQTDTKKQVIKNEYDELGRVKSRTEYNPASTAIAKYTRWFYDKYLGEGTARPETQRKLTAVVTSYGGISENCNGGNYCQTYFYDSASRLTDTITYLPGSSVGYINSVRFDSIGRVNDTYDVLQGVVTANGGSGTRTLYNDYGYVGEIRDLATGDILQKTIAVNARGQTKTEWRNNGGAGIVDYTYDDKTGLLKTQKASVAGGMFPIQDVTYDWDAVGNLKSRWNQSSNLARTGKKNLQESFCYDGLNRLIKSYMGTLTGSCSITTSAQDIEYDGLGNITRKIDVGVYAYSGKGAHAVTTAGSNTYAYDNNGNQTSGGGRNLVAYDTNDQPIYISAGATTTQFKYGPDNARWERVDTKNGINTVTHYLGNVERIEVQNSGIVEWKRYIAGAIYTVRTTATANGSGVSYTIQRTDKSFIYNDHLGSLDVVVNNLGQVTHTASFDAWGNRRSGEYWPSTFVASSLSLTNYTQPITQRGYTGHEMLDDTELIHMNGRIFDPRLARFMQADPFIQAASNTQSYNRYSYVLNNPLNKTDPSGYFFVDYLIGKYVLRPLFKAIGYENSQILIAIGSYACGPAAAYCAAMATYHLNRAYGASTTSAIISAGFAGLTAKTFEAAGMMAGGNPYGAFVAAGTVGGVMAEVQGGKFGHGFLTAGAGAAAGVSLKGWPGLMAATIIGGTASEMTGGKFANGAASAAFSYAAMWGIGKIGAGDNAPQDASTEDRKGLCESTGKCHPDDFSESDREGMQKRLDPIRKATLGKYGSNKEALLAVQKSGLVELNHEYGIEFWAQIDPVSHEVYKIDTGYDMKLSYGADLIRTRGDIIYHTHPSGRGIHFGDFGSAHRAGASWIFAGSKNGMDGYMNLSYKNYRSAQFIPYGQKWNNAPYCSFNGTWGGGCSL